MKVVCYYLKNELDIIDFLLFLQSIDIGGSLTKLCVCIPDRIFASLPNELKLFFLRTCATNNTEPSGTTKEGTKTVPAEAASKTTAKTSESSSSASSSSSEPSVLPKGIDEFFKSEMSLSFARLSGKGSLKLKGMFHFLIFPTREIEYILKFVAGLFLFIYLIIYLLFLYILILFL